MEERQATILVVDDEKAIRRMLKLSLEGNGYAVREAGSVAEALREVVYPLPDLVLLDLMLPDASGLDVLRRLREFSSVPVLVLSVVDTDESKIELLDAGADDYITKPFSMGELLARIRVALRHAETQEPEEELECGGIRLLPAQRSVRVAGTEVHLTPTEYALLLLLMKHVGRVITREEIIKQVWGTGMNETNALRVHVTQLRKKISAPGVAAKVETVPGVGLRIATPAPAAAESEGNLR